MTYKRWEALLIVNVMLASASIYTYFSSGLELFFVTLLMFTVSVIPHVLKSQLNLHVPLVFVYVAVLFIFATVGLGELQSFYDRYPWWDMVMHFFSAVVLGIVGFLILYLFYATNKLHIPKLLVALFGLTFAIAIGAVWEIIEFTVDNTLGTNLQVSSLEDTMWDLIVDTLGALLAAAAGYLYLARVHVPIVEEIVDEFTEENSEFVASTESSPLTETAVRKAS